MWPRCHSGGNSVRGVHAAVSEPANICFVRDRDSPKVVSEISKMMRTALLASVSALALLVTNDVKAADLAVKAPAYVAPAPVYSWTGCYVGAHVGWGWGQNNNSQVSTGSFGEANPVSAAGSINTSGALFGGQVGCNYQFAPTWVVGLQGDFAGTDINGRASDPIGGVFTSKFDEEGNARSIGSKTDWLASITARLGYTIYNNQALLYVKGGAAWVNNQYDLANAFSGFTNNEVSETRTGWTVGVGAEWMISQHWSAFVEGNYYNFGNGNLLSSQTSFPFDEPPSTFSSGKQQIETVKIGVNYKFGWDAPAVVARY
jgi:outer membrane immunogenic protein